MDIGRCFNDAWDLFLLDRGPLTATAIIAAVVVGLVRLLVGFVAGLGFLEDLLIAIAVVVVYAWMYAVVFHMMLRRVREKRPAKYSDMQDFDRIGSFATAAVVVGVIIGLGYALLVIPGLLLTTIWVYALPLTGDRGVGLSEAMSQSKRLASASGLFTTFAAWLVGAVAVGVVVGVLNWIPVVGLVVGLLAVPFGMGYVVSMYFQAIGEGHLIAEAVDSAHH